MAYMACAPTISVESVELDDWPYVEVSVAIKGVFSDILKNEKLSDYFKAVCVLSIYDPSSGAMAAPPEAIVGTNIHWEDVEWYNTNGWSKYLRAEKIQPMDYTVFEFNIELLIDPSDDPETTKKNWSEAYLSYLTYIQVDTQQMAEDFNITIADEYKGMAGDYEAGVIMEGGVVVDIDARSFDVRDLRKWVETSDVYDSSKGTKGEAEDIDTVNDPEAPPKINKPFGTLSKIEGEDNIEEGTVEAATMGEYAQ